jgi:hypothetical protein
MAGVPAARAAARVFVSVNGTDAGNCSDVNAPCRTLNFAIGAVDAAGEVIVLTTGSYAGATIGKSVKVNVPTGVVAFTAQTVTVAAGVSDVVVLRGLTIKALTPGTGTGINYTAGAKLYVENCVVDGWLTGISMTGADGQLFVKDTTVRNSSGHGLHALPVSGTALASIDLSRFEGNGGCGVHMDGGAKGAVRDSVASGGDQGFCAEPSSGAAELSVQNSVASNNTQAGIMASGGGAVARATSCIVTGNGTGFENNGATFQSLGNNLVEGNTTDTAGTITVVTGQ